MNFSADSKNWERFALLATFIALIWMGPANIWDNNIDHGHPYGYFAQDTFIFLSYQYYLEESGNWKQLAPSLARGYTDVVQSQPPMLETLSVLLAQATGLGFYTTTYLIVMLLVIAAVFCFYFLIRSFNPKVALLSLPFSALIFSPVFMTAFTWGNWPFFAGSAMFMLFFWCLNNIRQRWMPALGALAMAAIVLGHTSEYVFIVPLVGFLFLIDALGKEFRWDYAKRVIGMAVGSALISFHSLITFRGTFLHNAEAQFITPDVSGLGMFVSVTTAGIPLALATIAGIALGALMLRKHRALQISFVLFLIGFTNYLGTGKRGLETRYLWPIYLSVFLGLLIFVILTKVAKMRLPLRTCAFISIALTALLAHQYYAPIDGAGLASPDAWRAMEWVARETPKDATVLYVYGDAYSQAGVLFNTQRLSSAVLVDDYVSMAQSGGLRRTVQTERISDRTNAYPYRTGAFTFGFHQFEDNVTVRGPEDICTFDYLVFDTASRIPGAGAFNQQAAQSLLQRANFTQAFQNNGVVILNNPRPGGECFA
jgi:hypothetical protein